MNWTPVGPNHFQASTDDRLYDLRAVQKGRHPWVLTARGHMDQAAVNQEIGCHDATSAQKQAKLWIETAKYIQ